MFLRNYSNSIPSNGFFSNKSTFGKLSDNLLPISFSSIQENTQKFSSNFPEEKSGFVQTDV